MRLWRLHPHHGEGVPYMLCGSLNEKALEQSTNRHPMREYSNRNSDGCAKIKGYA
jgi:muconolactone delta-isomerase